MNGQPRLNSIRPDRPTTPKAITVVIAALVAVSVSGCAAGNGDRDMVRPPPPSPADELNALAKGLADQLCKGMDRAKPRRVAVFTFVDHTHQYMPLCVALRERLSSDLQGRPGVQVIAVEQVDRILARLKFVDGTADNYAPDSLAQAHDLLDCDVILTGAISDAQTALNADCRLVDFHDVQLASAVGTMSKPTSFDFGPSPLGPVAVAPDASLQPLAAPIALYPDNLLLPMLVASTYPEQVKSAIEWTQGDGRDGASDEKIALMPWDQSIQALVHYPPALQKLADDPAWTQSLGAAVRLEGPQLMATIQDLRAQARDKNSLRSDAKMAVADDGNNNIYIRPAGDQLFIPTYDPALVYAQECDLGYSGAYPTGNWLGYNVDYEQYNIYCGDWQGGWREGPNGRWAREPHFAKPSSAQTWVRDDRGEPPPDHVGPFDPNAYGHGQSPVHVQVRHVPKFDRSISLVTQPQPRYQFSPHADETSTSSSQEITWGRDRPPGNPNAGHAGSSSDQYALHPHGGGGDAGGGGGGRRTNAYAGPNPAIQAGNVIHVDGSTGQVSDGSRGGGGNGGGNGGGAHDSNGGRRATGPQPHDNPTPKPPQQQTPAPTPKPK